MSELTLDTSGAVYFEKQRGSYRWPDLDAFTQGYGEVAARELYGLLIAQGWTPEAASAAVAFRNWSPEALAMILADCAQWLGEFIGRSAAKIPQRADCGREFWRIRQDGKRRTFPPLTVSLGDDGKVKLAKAVKP